MLLRNVNERLQIICRKDCKNETEFNKKLFKVRNEYMTKYKSVICIGNDIGNDNNTTKINTSEQTQIKLE